jgi:ABC-2 type transport system ATP-binding protein
MESIIEILDLRKAYGDLRVLSGIDLSITKGEVFGLLGANGAGKSTMIECILGTRKADGGSISILGMSPQKERKKLFEQVGVQFQEATYPDKIRVDELCQETSCLYRNPANYKELLDRFGLAEKKKSFVSELSGGKKQRLFIILALIPNPQVVFLDELTTGLDTKARRSVWKSLKELKEKGSTILLTSHFMDEVEELCDRIGILKDGQFLFCGTIPEAIAKSPYEKLEDAYLWFTGEGADEDE